MAYTEYVNLVADGSLHKEFEMEGLQEYVSEHGHIREVHEEEGATTGLEIKFDVDGNETESVVIHENGVYVIKCDSKKELFNAHEEFIKHMLKLDLIHEEPNFTINNLVAVYYMDADQVDLNEFSTLTGEESFYNSEDFPAVSYSPNDTAWNANVFANGKATITADGFSTVEKCKREIDTVVESIKEPESKYDLSERTPREILEEESRIDLDFEALKEYL